MSRPLRIRLSFAIGIMLGVVIEVVRVSFWIALTALFFWSWWDAWEHPGPRDGARCGPHHHWTYVGNVFAGDMSCEPDE
jgi:hypothetical protein